MHTGGRDVRGGDLVALVEIQWSRGVAGHVPMIHDLAA